MNTDFAQEWLMAWNSHDLNKIMEHYSEKIDFVSPIIQQMGINAEGKISNKSDLKDYFSKALQKYPDLHFELYHELKGSHSIVLFYRSVNNSFSAEYMELNNEGKVSKVRVHYKIQ
ncbi:nuclear transport factor 2 family protein [Zunongwangia pacifica]|uniref:Nuclear transport factor 2 family protein n=1 Tax=Zunongwangia pacifica TaxID=2911062 RepID=A0A9X2A2J8_9FLAO|nr:nuclear transport factor 2 family protein [Zunongwangia pacifica]MCL6218959.1 nuclear transport factor 2 family protein [Zunongwangia pacifica]